MNLQSCIDDLRQQLVAASEGGSECSREAAERMALGIDPAVRLVLLEALSTACEEISVELAPGSVEVRLRGRDPEFVVTLPAMPDVDQGDVDQTGSADDEGKSVRITLRLPENLKVRIDDCAARESVSTNAWIVRALARAAAGPECRGPQHRRGTGQSFSGWVR